MGFFEEAGGDSTPILVKYYCTRCEEFFTLSPIAPLRCPMCYCDPRYILGPIPVKEIDINKLERKRRTKYKGAYSK